jgi:hypothetical protein
MIHYLQELWKWHPMLSGAAVMAIANACVTSMPSPDEKSGKFYNWAFAASHALILAIPRLLATYAPKEPPKPPAP